MKQQSMHNNSEVDQLESHGPEFSLRMKLRPSKPERLMTTKLVARFATRLDATTIELQCNIA